MDPPLAEVPDERAWISLPFWEIRGRVGALLRDPRELRKTAVRLSRLVDRSPTPQGLYALLLMYRVLAEHTHAEAVRRWLRKRFPKSAEFHLAMGEEAELRNDYVAAHAAYTEAARVQPNKYMEDLLRDFFDRWGGLLSGRKGPAKRREQAAWVYLLRDDPTPSTTTPVPIPRTP